MLLSRKMKALLIEGPANSKSYIHQPRESEPKTLAKWLIMLQLSNSVSDDDDVTHYSRVNGH